MGVSKANRAARMTVLEWTESGSVARNLFTIVRHRRQEALGPWESQGDECWSMDDLGNGLRMHRFDASLEQCQSLVGLILDAGKLEMDGVEVTYVLHPNPRRHWAYRDESPLTDASMLSPFRKHSAEVIEYWSFESALRAYWLEVLDSPPDNLATRLVRLGFPLDRQVERVGNLMIAGAEDAIACDLGARHDQILRFKVDADNLPPDAYSATIWASHSGDEIIRQQMALTPGHTGIKLASDVDHVGFSIFRTSDGQCIDLMEADLLKEVHLRTQIDSGPTLHIRDRRGRSNHAVKPTSPTEMSSLRFDEQSAEVDQGIRRWWLDRRLYEHEAKARKERDLVRFQPEEYDQAVQHMILLLRRDSHRSEPIYLADPHFMPYLDENKETEFNLVQLYLELFAATVGQALRILCAKEEDPRARPWWLAYPKAIVGHVSIRSFRMRNGGAYGGSKHVFHDRYLTTAEHEVIITNSLNGWHKHGVTFVSHRHGVYSAEAERLWSISDKSVNEPIVANELL